MTRLRVGVLISGRGSNLHALIEAAADPAYPAEIAAVISNRAAAPGLEHAASAGVPPPPDDPPRGSAPAGDTAPAGDPASADDPVG